PHTRAVQARIPCPVPLLVPSHCRIHSSLPALVRRNFEFEICSHSSVPLSPARALSRQLTAPPSPTRAPSFLLGHHLKRQISLVPPSDSHPHQKHKKTAARIRRKHLYYA